MNSIELARYKRDMVAYRAFGVLRALLNAGEIPEHQRRHVEQIINEYHRAEEAVKSADGP